MKLKATGKQDVHPSGYRKYRVATIALTGILVFAQWRSIESEMGLGSVITDKVKRTKGGGLSESPLAVRKANRTLSVAVPDTSCLNVNLCL